MKKVLSRKEQERYLYDRIGGPVRFTYPEGPPLRGKLLDRCVIFDSEDDSVVYWNMIDLIEFEGEDENWLRITYYRYNKERRSWNFAGQTSISDPIDKFVELFEKAIKEKEWMQHLFREICRQCEKELKIKVESES